MERTLIKGNTALAARLGVHRKTVDMWRKKGILDGATVAEYCRTIIYDLDLVLQCLHHKKVKPGRKA